MNANSAHTSPKMVFWKTINLPRIGLNTGVNRYGNGDDQMLGFHTFIKNIKSLYVEFFYNKFFVICVRKRLRKNDIRLNYSNFFVYT